jgi:predicted alpha/beta-fold hydrolase
MTREYTPLPRWKGGHWMTLYAWGKPRHFPSLPPPEPRYFDAAPGTRLLAHCHWQRRPWQHPTIILLHGLESSSDAHYLRGLSDKSFAAGFNSVRLNQRNCGGTEDLTDSLYHSGLTHDPGAVMRELIEVDGLRSIAVAGYSLGGNLALKLAGDFGSAPPRELCAICAVSPTMDLAGCVEALEQPQNRIYQRHFVRNLKQRMRRKARAFPGQFSLKALPGVSTIRGFDDAYTAPFHGFHGASDYYQRASAMRVIEQISVSTLIISAEDDPFVPSSPFRDPAVLRNPHLTVRLTPNGGHCGFVEEAHGVYDGYWAEREIVTFLQERCKT